MYWRERRGWKRGRCNFERRRRGGGDARETTLEVFNEPWRDSGARGEGSGRGEEGTSKRAKQGGGREGAMKAATGVLTSSRCHDASDYPPPQKKQQKTNTHVCPMSLFHIRGNG